MSININPKNDMSFLFTNASSKDGFSSMNWMKDYSLVKSGAYSKLMKAYYSEDDSKETSKAASKALSDKAQPVKEKETVSDSYNKLSSAAKSVQDSVKKIQELPEDKTEPLVSAVKDFVTNYNSMVEAAGKGDIKNDKSVAGRLTALSSLSTGYSAELEAIGVGKGDDGKLKVDEGKLSKADAASVKKVFDKHSSYGNNVNVSANMIQSNANYGATRNSIYDATARANAAASSSMFDLFT